MSKREDDGWQLSKDGILWKRVARNCDTIVSRDAESFVAQLERAVGPVNALQGLLLDRIAANCLRKHNLLLRPSDWYLLSAEDPLFSRAVAVLRYEGQLDQSFHRDLILLLQLKKMAPAPALAPKKPPQSDRSLVAGQADSDVPDQAAGGSAVARPAPVARKQSVKRPPLDAASVDLD